MSSGQVTRILRDYAAGDREKLDELFPLVYDDLRKIAHNRLRDEPPGHTLDTTAVVHEAYVNLVDRRAVEWQDRAHFFAVASRVIRHVLVDYARRKHAAKRGGRAVRVPLKPSAAAVRPDHLELLALEDVLSRLEEHDPRLARVVECRFFGGMSVRETAEAVDASTRTVDRDWKRAKAYLREALVPRNGESTDRGTDREAGGEG